MTIKAQTDSEQRDSLVIRYYWPLPFDTLGHRKGDWVSSVVKGFFELCWASYRKAGYQK